MSRIVDPAALSDSQDEERKQPRLCDLLADVLIEFFRFIQQQLQKSPYAFRLSRMVLRNG